MSTWGRDELVAEVAGHRIYFCEVRGYDSPDRWYEGRRRGWICSGVTQEEVEEKCREHVISLDKNRNKRKKSTSVGTAKVATRSVKPQR
jgi:hypothetical protein